MALNFPSNTSQPYIDPVSGLKYIFNSSVGAWETAIQPPVIVSETPPSLDIPGFLWWDSIGGKLYVKYEDVDSKQWVDTTPAGDSFPGAVTSEFPPPNPIVGDIWLDISDPQNPTLKIYGVLQGTLKWIQVTYPSIPFSIPKISSSDRPSFANENDIWFDSNNKTFNVFKNGNWVSQSNETNSGSNFQNVIGIGSIHVSRDDNFTISVTSATTSQRGVIKIATQNQVNLGKIDTVAVSPASLRTGIKVLSPISSIREKGMIRLATKEEAINGTSDNHAITPKTLNDKIESLDFKNPVGTIINHAGDVAPDGYMVCDGRILNRNDYRELFSIIGTKYGIGDGITTFALPNKDGDFLVCIKF